MPLIESTLKRLMGTKEEVSGWFDRARESYAKTMFTKSTALDDTELGSPYAQLDRINGQEKKQGLVFYMTAKEKSDDFLPGRIPDIEVRLESVFVSLLETSIPNPE